MMKDERYYQAYLSHQQISRRGLFRGVLGGTQKTLSTEQKRTATRPPFACPQKAISAQLEIDTEKCNGCGECKIACYVAVIGLRVV